MNFLKTPNYAPIRYNLFSQPFESYKVCSIKVHENLRLMDNIVFSCFYELTNITGVAKVI